MDLLQKTHIWDPKKINRSSNSTDFGKPSLEMLAGFLGFSHSLSFTKDVGLIIIFIIHILMLDDWKPELPSSTSFTSSTALMSGSEEIIKVVAEKKPNTAVFVTGPSGEVHDSGSVRRSRIFGEEFFP